MEQLIIKLRKLDRIVDMILLASKRETFLRIDAKIKRGDYETTNHGYVMRVLLTNYGTLLERCREEFDMLSFREQQALPTELSYLIK